jgi:transposase InsO family protein
MKNMGIEAIYRRANTSKPAPGHKIWPYLLRKLAVTRPNHVWAMDLTYVRWLAASYLCAVVDWFSRRVLSWRLSITMEADFCIEAVEEVLARYGKPADAGSGLLQRADSNDGGGRIEAEIHLAQRPKQFRQTEPPLKVMAYLSIITLPVPASTSSSGAMISSIAAMGLKD